MEIALVGAGLMGRRHARTIAQSPHRLSVVVDPKAEAADVLAAEFDAQSARDLKAARGADAVIIASSAETHHEVALELIGAGVPVLVEKPLAATASQVDEMLSALRRSGTPMLCGFVERFNPVIAFVREQVSPSEIMRITTDRHSQGPHDRRDVVSDLMIHDIDLVLHLMQAEPCQVTGDLVADSHGMTRAATCSLEFDNGATARLSASYVTARKERLMRVEARDRTFDIDLQAFTVTVVDAAGKQKEFNLREDRDPLTKQLEHFVALVGGGDNGSFDDVRATHGVVSSLLERVE